jgi:hypothetical protein
VKTPDFDELVGTDLREEERARLRRVHDLLVTAGPPPDLPPSLAEPPAPRGTMSVLPNRRRGLVLLLAAALAAATFGIGYLVGNRGESFASKHTVTMNGTAAAPRARAALLIAGKDSSGNWPMKMTVRGLKLLPSGSYYELLLTKPGRKDVSCGTFNVHGTSTTVTLNVAYPLKPPLGWIVRQRGPKGRNEVVLTT